MADLTSARGGDSVQAPTRQVKKCEFGGAARPTTAPTADAIDQAGSSGEERYGYQAPEASLDETQFGCPVDRRRDDRPVVHHPGRRPHVTSEPVLSNGVPVGWRVRGGHDTDTAISLQAQVICLAV